MDEALITILLMLVYYSIGIVLTLIVMHKELLKAYRYDRLMRFKMLVDSKKH